MSDSNSDLNELVEKWATKVWYFKRDPNSTKSPEQQVGELLKQCALEWSAKVQEEANKFESYALINQSEAGKNLKEWERCSDELNETIADRDHLQKLQTRTLDERDALHIRNGTLATELELMTTDRDQWKARAEKAEVLLLCWSGTFQKYQSWFANKVPAKDWPVQVVEDYNQLSKLKEKQNEI